jgi:hypothetical protein
MKRIIVLVLLGFMAITLAACDDGTVVPEDILDCVENPDDPDCNIDEVDCVVNPDDPACEEAEECQDGYQEINGTCVEIDDRTPGEIAADLIIANWDGSMDHVDTMMNQLDFSDGMTLKTEFNASVTDEYGATILVNQTQEDSYLYGDYTLMKRDVSQTFDDITMTYTILFEETDTGVIVYYDSSFLRAYLGDIDPNGEIEAVLDALDMSGTWLMFKFDDSLANVVELEVLKEMIVLAFYNEFGDDVFMVLENELEYELGVEFSDYGLDLDQFISYLIDEDFESAGTMLDGFDYETMFADLDQLHLVPEIVDHMTYYEADYLLIDPDFDLQAEIDFLELNGTEAWLDQLTDAEISMLIEAHTDTDVSGAYDAYLADELEEYILQLFINDADVQYELSMIDNFDEAAFTTMINDLDVDALYEESIDVEALAMAIYNGQVAFDIYVTSITADAPNIAAFLTYLSPLVADLEPTIDEIDLLIADIEYGFNNLDMFADYVDPAYYLDNEMVILSIDADDDFNIITTATLDGSSTGEMFDDFITDFYWYLDGFSSVELPYVDYINCPAGEVCDPFDEYPEILSALAQLGDIDVSMSYNPLEMDEMELRLDFTSMVQALALMDNASSTLFVNDVSFTITQSEGADIIVPTDDITDMNVAVENFAKFSLNAEALDYLENIMDYYNAFPSNLSAGVVYLEDLEPFIGVSLAFDTELSYVEVYGNETDGYDYQLVLFWLDGTNVFQNDIMYSALVDAMDMSVMTATTYQAMLDNIDPDNFNMTKLFLVYMWEEYADYPVIY